MNFIRLFLIFFICFAASALNASNSCFLALEAIDKEYKGIKYKSIKNHKVSVSNLSQEKDVVIGLDPNGHSNIYFDGHRIDSDGPIGLRVTSYLKSGTIFNGAVLVVIKNPPKELVDKLKTEVDSFKPTHRLTCVKATCHHLGIKKNIYTPNQLLNRFIEIKNEDDLSIEIYTLNNWNIGEIKEGFKNQVKQNLVNFGTMASVLAIPLILSVFERL